ncbi:MAG: hypothetical protein M2R45_01456 [Verrucomicrobia subdivision 3 bacterium]|nr:hypothetical protein [Limisphaerales bacterium]MCS1417599.1 hypothetical protein [Limisphaerales bacterium]
MGPNDLIRLHLTQWNRRSPFVVEDGLVQGLRQRSSTPEQAFDHLRQLNRSVEFWPALQDPEDAFWESHGLKEVRSNITTLNRFRLIQPQGAPLTAWELWDKSDFLELLRWLETIEMRRHVVRKGHAQESKDGYNPIARLIHEGSHLEDILERLRKVCPRGGEFIYSFAGLSFSPKIPLSHWQARHLLMRIERHLTRKSPATKTP